MFLSLLWSTGTTAQRQVLFLMFSLAEGDKDLEKLSDLISYHGKSADSHCVPHTLVGLKMGCPGYLGSCHPEFSVPLVTCVTYIYIYIFFF